MLPKVSLILGHLCLLLPPPQETPSHFVATRQWQIQRVVVVQLHLSLAVLHRSSWCGVWSEPQLSCGSGAQGMGPDAAMHLLSPAAEFSCDEEKREG